MMHRKENNSPSLSCIGFSVVTREKKIKEKKNTTFDTSSSKSICECRKPFLGKEISFICSDFKAGKVLQIKLQY